MEDQMNKVLLQEFSSKQLIQLDEIIAKYRKEPGGLILLLEDAQDIIGYLPMIVLKKIAYETDIPLSQIYGVVTFYSFFTMKLRGRHTIQICLGTACYVKGGKENAQVIEKEYQVKPGETTLDRRFTYETVRCLGVCGLAPVMVVDGEVYGRVQPSKVIEILEKYK